MDEGEKMSRRGKTGGNGDSVPIMGSNLSVGKREVEGEQ